MKIRLFLKYRKHLAPEPKPKFYLKLHGVNAIHVKKSSPGDVEGMQFRS